MSSYATPSRLAQAEAVGRVLVVAMNEAEFVAFSQKSAIGTKDLAGCSVVVIASAYGAIMAHIPPRPIPDTSDPYAGDQNVHRLMERVGSLYAQRRDHFPDTDTYAMFAIYNGGVALSDQKSIIGDKITEMGLQNFNTVLYITPRDPTNEAHGTVFVDSLNRAGQKPVVYSEDRQVSSEQQPAQQAQQTQQTPSTWIWSGAHRRYYRWITKDGAQQVEWAAPSG